MPEGDEQFRKEVVLPDTFDHPPFMEILEAYKTDKNGKRMPIAQEQKRYASTCRFSLRCNFYDWKPFSLQKVRQFLALYIFPALALHCRLR